uniref:glycoside hydrolase family 28 protein n=1 Tax=Gemmiger sp. TaxID=2049027 RepID=UPI003FEE6BB4
MQRAINDCRADDILYFPAGDYLTGALQLHSDLEIYLSKGAVLQGTANINDYSPRIPSRFEGTEMRCYSSLLNAGRLDHTKGSGCHNIIVRGKGTICGGGQVLAKKIIEDERARIKSFLDDNEELVKSCENDDTIPGRVRPRLVNLSNCENVWFSGITFKNSPAWTFHMVYCDNIQTDHCVFESEGVWNGDGWDPDSSTNCTLFASEFHTGDDAVAIKSGKNPEGNEIGRPCAHIKVFDCRIGYGHGICIGSEMSGGVEDVQIWDCDFANSLYGIEIKATPKRGGYVRGVTVRDCTAPRVILHSVSYNDDGEPAPEPPKFSHCWFEGLTLTGRTLDHDHIWQDAAPIEIVGFDCHGGEIEDITFKDITITKESAELKLGLCSGVTMNNVSCKKA